MNKAGPVRSARPAVRSAAVPSMQVEGLLGATAPFGYFDPLGFSKGKTLEAAAPAAAAPATAPLKRALEDNDATTGSVKDKVAKIEGSR